MEWLPTITKAGGPLFRQIVRAIESDIAAGHLRRGQQMPTHRALAVALGIDLTTATRAYSEARRRGLLDARVGQGTFVSESTARAGTDIPDDVSIDLSMNVPPQPVEADLDGRIMRGLSAIHERAGLSSYLSYQQPGGTEQDRAAACTWLRPRLPNLAPERVVIFPGSQVAIFSILLTHLKPGDVVLTETLTFPGVIAAAQRLGLTLTGVAMDGEGMIPAALSEAIQTTNAKAVYLIPTMNNPTTATMSLARRKQIVHVLRRAKVLVIEDDAYGALDPAQRLLAELLPGQTFLTASLSKCLTPAFRVSYLVAPNIESAEALCVSLQATNLMAPPLMVALVTQLQNSGEAGRIIAAIRNEAIGRQELAARILKRCSFSSHSKGHHVWLPLPRGQDRTKFVSELFRQGLAVVDSEVFAVGRATSPAVRLCLGAARNRAELAEALHRLVRILNRASGTKLVV